MTVVSVLGILGAAPSPTPFTGEGGGSGIPWYSDPRVIAAGLALFGVVLTLVVKLYVDGRLARIGAIELARFERAAERELEALRTQYARLRSEEDAELSYRYETRKRLLQTVQPLVIQLRRQAVEGRQALRVFTTNFDRWSSLPDSVINECLYRMLAPQVTARLLDERVVDFDLDVDPPLAQTFRIAQAFKHCWEPRVLIGRAGRSIVPVPDEMLLERVPAREYLHASELEDILNGMRTTGVERCVTLAEFNARLRTLGPLAQDLATLDALLRDWSPDSKPVLSHLLAAQDLLLLAMSQQVSGTSLATAPPAGAVVRLHRNGEDRVDSLEDAFAAVSRHLVELGVLKQIV